MKRRDFLKTAGLAGVGIAGAGLIGCERSGKSSATKTVSDNCKPDTRGFKYFGTGKNTQEYYYATMKKPATVIDYGLTPDQEARASELHKSLYIFDGEYQVDYYEGLLDNMLSGGSAGVGGSSTMGAFGRDLVNGLGKDKMIIRPNDWWSRASLDRDLAFMDQLVKAHGDKFMICRNYADLMTAKGQGKVATMLDVQNTMFIANDLDLLEHYYKKGLTRVQLSYNGQSMSASGCMEPQDSGVTMFGKRVIEKLNELNMLVDVGHCSVKTMDQAIDISSKPVACSHAGMRSIAPDNPRTHTDEGLKKLAEHGGVLGVVGVPGTLIPGASEASVKDFVNAIDRAVNLMGIDHVGFALDQVTALSDSEFFTSPDWPPEAVAAVSVTDWPWTDSFAGMENQSGYPNLTRGLVAKGYKDDDIRKIMGGNMMRLIKEVIG